MLEREPFFSKILELPASQVAYEAGRRLRTSCQRQNRAFLEIEAWSFDVAPFALESHCEYTPLPELHQQIPVVSHREGDLFHESENSWHRIRWQGHEFDLVHISWCEGYGRKDRHFLLAPTMDVGEAFVATVCAWNEEIRGEVLVFHEASWYKDEELYLSIQGISFDDLVLPEGMREELQRDVVDFFACPKTYKKYGIPWKRGVLLHGPPGNGKTHAVKAILNTVQKPRLYVKSFRSGCCTPEESIRLVFQRARQVAPCVLIFEDLDSLLTDENRSFFLNELDGFAPNEGILALATTNHADRLDAALVKRPSRFDRKYAFALPQQKERLAYIALWNDTLESPLQIDKASQRDLAACTEGFSYAFLKELFVSGLMAWIKEAQRGNMKDLLRKQASLLQEQLQNSAETTCPKGS